MIRRRVSLLLELLVTVMTPVAWSFMLFRLNNSGLLAASGLRSLRYFTVLSNLLSGAASLCCLCIRRRPAWLIRLRLVAASAVSLTALTVALVLGPIFGYRPMYMGANLWFHLILPVASFIGFILLDGPRPLPRASTGFTVLPTFIYGVGYCANIAIRGRGTWPATNDWYGFLFWGWPVGMCFFAALLLLTWLTAMLLRSCYNQQPPIPPKDAD